MKLSIQIREDPNGGFVAVCPSLPGCVSRGTTRLKARENLDEAICGYVAAVSNFVPEDLLGEVIEA